MLAALSAIPLVDPIYGPAVSAFNLIKSVPAIFFPEGATLAQTLWSLVLAFFALGFVLNAITTFIYRHKPLTILATQVDVFFHNSMGSRVEVVRKQILRAEQPNVEALFGNVTVNYGGRIPEREIDAKRIPKVAGDIITHTGSEHTGWETIHEFHPPPPYSWLAQLFIPDQVFQRMDPEKVPGWARKIVFARCITDTDYDEHTGEKSHISFSGEKYSHTRVQVRLHFHSDRMPESEELIRAMLIESRAVKYIPPEWSGRPEDPFIVNVDKLGDRRLSISWQLPPARQEP